MNPYQLDSPAVVSFSGGRTSGMMLWHILQAFGGTLPDGVKVVFCNTGKERPETLDFVERCSQEWGVDVVWLEYTSTPLDRVRKVTCNGKLERPYVPSFTIVNRATADTCGTPFERVIADRGQLPNPLARFCTVELKTLTTVRYLQSVGWDDGWQNAIGIRADEPHRWAKVTATNRHAREEAVMPLFTAGATLADVMRFWSRQPFDLRLEQHEGNCDLCFIKSVGKTRRIMADRPDLADWWPDLERRFPANDKHTHLFRRDRPPYRVQLDLAQRPGLFDDTTETDELSVACHCTD